jgi:hypothetical protein
MAARRPGIHDDGRADVRAGRRGHDRQRPGDGYPDTPDGRRALLDCAAGWGEALTLCRFFLERGVGRT